MHCPNNGRLELPAEKEIITGVRHPAPALKNVLLCRKAYVDESGHNFYEGEFRTILVKNIPDVAEELFVITKWGEGAGAGFRQEIRIFEPSGTLELFSSADLEENFVLRNIYHEHLIIGRVSGLLLPREGRYRMEISLNGEPMGKAYFNVVNRKERVTCREKDLAGCPHEAQKAGLFARLQSLITFFNSFPRTDVLFSGTDTGR